MTKEKTQKNSFDLSEFEFQYDNILLEEVEPESVIKRPQQYDDKPAFGKVIKTGKGRLLEDGTVVPIEVKVGDVVYFGKYSSIKERVAGKDYYIVREEDIMAVHAGDK